MRFMLLFCCTFRFALNSLIIWSPHALFFLHTDGFAWIFGCGVCRSIKVSDRFFDEIEMIEVRIHFFLDLLLYFGIIIIGFLLEFAQPIYTFLRKLTRIVLLNGTEVLFKIKNQILHISRFLISLTFSLHLSHKCFVTFGCLMRPQYFLQTFWQLTKLLWLVKIAIWWYVVSKNVFNIFLWSHLSRF